MVADRIMRPQALAAIAELFSELRVMRDEILIALQLPDVVAILAKYVFEEAHIRIGDCFMESAGIGRTNAAQEFGK